MATSGGGGIGNYIGVCVFVAAFGVADAHVQGGMTGDLSFMSPHLMQVQSFHLSLLDKFYCILMFCVNHCSRSWPVCLLRGRWLQA